MDWTQSLDGYCERVGPDYWAEPLNALSNLGFMIAAVIMWRRCGGMPKGRIMAGALFVIGVGSWLFHTHATRWAEMADVVPILGFVVLYLWRANRDYLGVPRLWAGVLTALYVPVTAVFAPILARLPLLGVSAAYLPLPVLIAGYGLAVRKRARATAVGLGIGAGVLLVSLTFRSLDMPLCDDWPVGTHFIWHLLNAVMLGWMIEVWRRDQIAKR